MKTNMLFKEILAISKINLIMSNPILRVWIGAHRRECSTNTARALIHPNPTCHQGNSSPSSLSEIKRCLAQPRVAPLRKVIWFLRSGLLKLENLEVRGSLVCPADAPVSWAIYED